MRPIKHPNTKKYVFIFGLKLGLSIIFSFSVFSKVIQIEQILVSKRKNGIWIQCAEKADEERWIMGIKKAISIFIKRAFL